MLRLMQSICKLLVVTFVVGGCIQINLGSNVVNVSSQKLMSNSKGQIVGSELKEIEAELKAKVDAKVPLK